jgi:hypothetical protein
MGEDSFGKARTEETRRPRHWTDAVTSITGLLGFIAVLAFIFGLIYLAHNHWTF